MYNEKQIKVINMKKVYFSISLKNRNHFTAWSNFDLLQVVKIGAKQGRKNISLSDGIYCYEITRLDYKHIKELSGVEMVNDMRDLVK